MVSVNVVDMGDAKGGIVVDEMRVVVVVVVNTDVGTGAGVVAVGPGKSAELMEFETPTRSDEARFWLFENLSRTKRESSKERTESLEDDVRLAFLKPAQFLAHSVHPGRHGSRSHGYRSVRRPSHWRLVRSGRQGWDQRGTWRQYERHAHVQVGWTRTLSRG